MKSLKTPKTWSLSLLMTLSMTLLTANANDVHHKSNHLTDNDCRKPTPLTNVDMPYDVITCLNDKNIAQVITFKNERQYFGVINELGDVIIPIEYDDIYIDDYIHVRRGGKNGLYDSQGNMILDVIYASISPIIDDQMVVDLNGKIGMVNTKADVIIPLKYQELSHFINHDILFAKSNDKWGIIHTNNNIIAPFIYQDININYGSKVHAIKHDGYWGVIDDTGRIILPFIYDHISVQNSVLNDETFIIINQSHGALTKFGVADDKGNIIIPIMYDHIGAYHEEVFVAALNGKYGYIDKHNQIIIDFIYDEAYYFYDSIAEVVLNGKRGKIDKQNNIISAFVSYETSEPAIATID